MPLQLEPSFRTRIALPARDLSWVSWAAACLLLAFEGFLLSERFDTDRLAGRGEAWVQLVRLLPFVPHLLAFSLAATCVLGHERLRASLDLLDGRRQTVRWALFAALGSVASFVGFAASARWTIERTPEDPFHTAAALLALASSGALWVFWTLALAAPAHRVGRFLGRTWDRFFLGLLTGGTVFLAAHAFESRELLWRPLSRATLVVAALLLRTFGVDVHSSPDELLLGTDAFTVIVTRFCSGYEGIGLYALCTGSFLALARRHLRWPAALWIVPIGCVLVWLFNAARIAALVAIGHGWSSDLAMEGFHTHAGWIPLISISLGSVALATRHRAFSASALEPDPTATRGATSVNPTAAHLMPLLILIATGLVAGAFLEEPRLAVPARVALGGLALLAYRRQRARLWTCPHLHLLWATPLALVLWVGSAAAQGMLATGDPTPIGPTGGLAFLFWSCAVASYVWITPAAEELAFRGFVQRRLVERDFERVPQGLLTPFACLATSLLFGLLHGNLAGGVLVGGLLAFATTWRGRLADAIQLHATVNLSLLLVALATGRHELWLGAAK